MRSGYYTRYIYYIIGVYCEAAISIGGKFCFTEKGKSRDFKTVVFAPRSLQFTRPLYNHNARMMIKYAQADDEKKN